MSKIKAGMSAIKNGGGSMALRKAAVANDDVARRWRNRKVMLAAAAARWRVASAAYITYHNIAAVIWRASKTSTRMAARGGSGISNLGIIARHQRWRAARLNSGAACGAQ